MITQNAIAQLVTGPLTLWKQMAFNIYYVLLFIITALIIFHLHGKKLILPSAGIEAAPAPQPGDLH